MEFLNLTSYNFQSYIKLNVIQSKLEHKPHVLKTIHEKLQNTTLWITRHQKKHDI